MIFEVTESENDIKMLKFKVAGPISRSRMTIFKNSIFMKLGKVFEFAESKNDSKIPKFKMADPNYKNDTDIFPNGNNKFFNYFSLAMRRSLPRVLAARKSFVATVNATIQSPTTIASHVVQ